jgi:hypothetical protein
MSRPTTFKVMWPWNREEVALLKRLGCPRRVPWALVAPHERQAVRNHEQTLERLNQRGGLDPCELVAVLEGKGLRTVVGANMEESVLRLLSLLDAWTADDEGEVQ